jgi:TldD protein
MLTHKRSVTVEADFVLAGSCARGKLGERVASELVTLCDSGSSELAPGAGGWIAVDDEGVPAGRATILERGVLKGYLHDRATAAHFGVEPTGNARAWEYDDDPLIRMRNTYIVPGDSSLEEMIEAVGEGYLLEARAMVRRTRTASSCSARSARGRSMAVVPACRASTSRASPSTMLRSVDAISRDFRWDLGSGHCGKGQPAKVDAGGPWLSCEVLVGGRRS